MDDHPVIKTTAGAAVVLSASLAYFAAPVFAFADSGTLATLGMGLGVGASGAWLAVLQGWGRRWEIPFLVVMVSSLMGLVLLTTDATTHYTTNKKRCVAIQEDMLSIAPRRADGPDLFQALRCQPQGAGEVKFLPNKQPSPPAPQS
jgi:hypothetical protein